MQNKKSIQILIILGCLLITVFSLFYQFTKPNDQPSIKELFGVESNE